MSDQIVQLTVMVGSVKNVDRINRNEKKIFALAILSYAG